jgi:hypothetical protein
VGDFKLDDSYNEVSERIKEFRAKYPEGSLQPWNKEQPYEVLAIDGAFYIAYVAAAYRTPDDERPGVGTAYEPVPGRTPFTKDSELQNAETAAWGRALIAVGAADANKGIASADELHSKRRDPIDEYGLGALSSEGEVLSMSKPGVDFTIPACPKCRKPMVPGPGQEGKPGPLWNCVDRVYNRETKTVSGCDGARWKD